MKRESIKNDFQQPTMLCYTVFISDFQSKIALLEFDRGEMGIS